ncbi:GMC oxidoreductase [Streptomyces sp. NPDC052415]|uniref:GMC oxidoreductase n=1 Tax=Streptomyces sp. NPDC052415 TaxID=3365690 RepID=UPI0037D2D90F
MPEKTPDVIIIGSGPVGCSFARDLVDAGKSVLMIDAGPQHSVRYGEHLKNAFLYQRNIDQFVSVIRGNLTPLSVATRNDPTVTLDPSAYRYDTSEYSGFQLNNQNPLQRENENLGACAATYVVGGMATHWTCAVPRFDLDLERTWKPAGAAGPQEYPINSADMDAAYTAAEQRLKRTTTAFKDSARHQLVKKVLRDAGFDVKDLPLAVERRTGKAGEFVTWSAADTVLRGEPDLAVPGASGLFKLMPEHQCLKLEHDGRRITGAVVRDLKTMEESLYRAKAYVVACGAVPTPQLLYASGLHERLPALGRYLTEQPMAFCQVVLRQPLVEGAADLLRTVEDPEDRDYARRAAQRVTDYRAKQQKIVRRNQGQYVQQAADPLPFRKDDPDPNLYIAASTARPWHCQIHRDAFSYGAVPPSIDTRLIVDLRWFGISRPRHSNWVEFDDTMKDTFDMPQATFHFKLTDAERAEAGRMMADMQKVAAQLGGYMPGSEPQFLTPGLPLHIAGTTRMGSGEEKEAVRTSVVSPDSQVWGFDNLWLGGNGLHPFGNAGNPTLTSVAMAVRAAKDILSKLPRTK